MTNCVTCGDALHPERAEKYDYCTKPKCQERNRRDIPIVAVGVNKAADQYVILNERTEQEMANGRYKKQPEPPESPRRLSGTRGVTAPGPVRVLVPPSSAGGYRPHWSKAQENLALIYRAMGMKPDEIARKLGVSPYLVTQILLAAS